MSGKILSKIFEYRSKKKNDIKPEDVKKIFVQGIGIIFLQEVGTKCTQCNKKIIPKFEC
jgi:hypothetical protein